MLRTSKDDSAPGKAVRALGKGSRLDEASRANRAVLLVEPACQDSRVALEPVENRVSVALLCRRPDDDVPSAATSQVVEKYWHMGSHRDFQLLLGVSGASVDDEAPRATDMVWLQLRQPAPKPKGCAFRAAAWPRLHRGWRLLH